MTTGREVLLEVLRSEGVTHVFGNPGSTELPLIDALATAGDLRYVLALQEATAVGMADGYALATGRPAFLNLHTSAGLGNAVGNLTNARANGTPLVVTAGQQDERHLAEDPLLSGPLCELAAPTCKWTHEVRSLGELGTLLRRAFADAAKPTPGPVFLSLRMDLLDRADDALAVPPRSTLTGPGVAAGVDSLVERLRAAANPAIVAGDVVADAGAQDALAAVADALGCPVYGNPLHARAVFDPTHRRWAGMLAPAAAAVRGALATHDVVLAVAGQPFLAYPYTPGPSLPESCALLHLSPDASLLGRAFPTALGLAGDVRLTLEAVATALGPASDGEEADAARRAAIESLEATALGRYGPAPLDPMAAAHALLRALPPGVAVVDEAITTGAYVRGFHHRSVADGYFFCKGGGLGWGMPAACGVSLGRGGEPVLCVVGDGSSMYSPQALWSAARERLPVVFAVVDNGQYRILKDLLRGMQCRSVESGTFVAMDLEPRVDHLALAASMGVAATAVDSAHDVGDAVRASLDTGLPHLLHVPIAAP